jgi:N-acetyl-gamma-glutamyl-phosphate reductase
MIKVGIVGATGYTGVELLRLLAAHPQVELAVITSRADAGTPVSDMFPNLRGYVDQDFKEPNIDLLVECDVVFFATPHCVAMEMVPELIRRGTRVIDLSADFRLKDATQWEHWYNMPHTCPELLSEAVYGLPEVNRAAIKEAQLIAVPGCYPTATQLGFLPLLENRIIDPLHLIADTKSGVSGAGRKAAVGTLLSEASENMKAYAVAGHRHLPEIEQGLSLASNQAVSLTFVPHLTPMIRGIHATLYGRITQECDLQALFEARYQNEPFVDVLPQGAHPETRSVRGANTCRIAVHRPQNSDTVVVLSVIDNLVKGASGQAIQNMNIMFGFEEQLAINTIPALP